MPAILGLIATVGVDGEGFNFRQAGAPNGNQLPSRRLYEAIDACPEYWDEYFIEEAMTWICACSQVEVSGVTASAATTYDYYTVQQACTTTTAKPTTTTLAPTTTTALVTTTTRTTTITTTTVYCEACISVTAAATTRTSTSTKTTVTTTMTTKTATTTAESDAVVTTTKTTTKTTTTRTAATTTTPDPDAMSTTTTTTVTTTTVTTVTQTTTVLQSCSICPLYHFLCPEGCTNCVAPGNCRTIYQEEDRIFDESCDTRLSQESVDSCVDFASVEISCPSTNLLTSRPVILEAGAYPQLKCRVCGIAALPTDGDPTQGTWAGTIGWGPNQFLTSISETEIQSYNLYVVDSMYQKLGDALANREVKLWNTLQASCCDTSLYKATISVALPTNATYFMVVPVTINGLELNVGPVSTRISDVGAATVAAGDARPLSPQHALALTLLLVVIVPISFLF